MGIEVFDRGAAQQDLSGQPIGAANGEPATESAAVTTEPAATEPAVTPPAEGAPRPAAVDIDPDTLRQLTTLTRERRELTRKLAEAEKRATPDPEIAAKLARLAELDAAAASPRKWLALSGKTLEDVAADVLAGNDVAPDPRVDALVARMDAEAKARGESEATRQAKEAEREAQAQAELMTKSVAHVQTVIANTKVGTELRWGALAKDKEAASEAVRASLIIRDRDYRNPDGSYKQFDSNAILEAALDEAEELLAFREFRKTQRAGGQAATSVPHNKGLEVRDVDERPKPKPTIGPERGSTRSSPTERGPTNVREARARALRVARGGID